MLILLNRWPRWAVRLFSIGALVLGCWLVDIGVAGSRTASAQDAMTNAEEVTIDAFVPWQGRGFTFPTGETQGTFVGMFHGPVYIKTEKGPAEGGLIVCPAMLDFNLETGKQIGYGKCTIAGEEGHRVFAEWSCQGIRLVGCKGEFKVTGGTGRFEGIVGTGPMVSRAGLHIGAADNVGSIVQEEAQGLIILDGLKLKLPAKE
ncbi:MAG: hypothetical protein AB7P52_15150 [Alphaproteobacteria bacterium]